eukprot:GHVU01010484.1.p3 GENE.GHVU01010484.1~~GHVU01010484.1.p3  ORF type:complete len:222 (+),score=27.85 GHVU01010484.1:53-667(+)
MAALAAAIAARVMATLARVTTRPTRRTETETEEVTTKISDATLAVTKSGGIHAILAAMDAGTTEAAVTLGVTDGMTVMVATLAAMGRMTETAVIEAVMDETTAMAAIGAETMERTAMAATLDVTTARKIGIAIAATLAAIRDPATTVGHRIATLARRVPSDKNNDANLATAPRIGINATLAAIVEARLLRPRKKTQRCKGHAAL